MSGTQASNRFSSTSTVAGRAVGFSAVSGEVVAVERWTETQVSTASGSVHVFGNNVAVNPPKVWATAVGRKAVWIRTAADELQIPVPENTQVRQGHRVHAVLATGLDADRSQWAAIVNHNTNRWIQVDRLPPSGCFDPWTGFVMGLTGNSGNPAPGAFWLYGIIATVFTFTVGRSIGSVFLGAVIGIVVGTLHCVFAGFYGKQVVREYAAAVKAACDGVFGSAGP